MNRLAGLWGIALGVVCVMIPDEAWAQRRGRTDGPERSEYGRGGYSRRSEPHVSLTFDWGAGFAAEKSRLDSGGPPLFVGGTLSFWGADWYQFDVSGNYVLQNGLANVLVGPRLRTYGFPLSFNVGLKAGGFFVPDEGVRFGISPQVGVDFLARRHLLLGLGYALDVPIASHGITNRIFMNIGFRL
ncbi:hypothetical protein [Melittangium boletus]|uniref:Outer membrane protein beta-barrel domain-containing protein n=1 Tax=Melittangium boletus DSM 14713 TaxID=1294270 RepID=A0A250IAB2_9BACT|nr:hypothetical protein [Melittangium boletus]ATB27896.1 hypothetical protein MEBOL_001341 [Melittangium boletus DSM 14713]